MLLPAEGQGELKPGRLRPSWAGEGHLARELPTAGHPGLLP